MKKYILILLMALPIQSFAGHVSVNVNVGPVVAIGYANVRQSPAIIPYYGEPLAIGYYYDDDGFLCYKHNRSELIIRYTEFSRHNMRRRVHHMDQRRHQPTRHDRHDHRDNRRNNNQRHENNRR